MVWIDLAQDRNKWSSFKHGNKPSGSVKYWEILV
jgi:hypothetical protein